MRIKFFHLNILHGKYFKNLARYCQKQNFDIMNFQEVAGGISLAKKNSKIVIFRVADNLQQLTQAFPQYQISPAIAWRYRGFPTAYDGKATLIRKKFPILDRRVIPLKRYQVIEPKKIRIQNLPHNTLSQTIEINRKKIEIINTHLAWGPRPNDTKYKLRQNRKLVKYIQSLKRPFILSGDFNLDPSSQIVKALEKLAVNLGAKYKIKTTLNPRIHYARRLFPPGLVVDYIFASKNIRAKSFRVADEVDVSDHLGLEAGFEI